MVGNDVVDLADAETLADARHPRFDVRVFSPDERRRLAAAGSDSRLRWFLWAAKESAYKVAKQRRPDVVFAPIRFVTEISPDLRGSVRHGDDRYAVRLMAGGDWVHAVATAASHLADRVTSGVRVAVAAEAAGSSRDARRFAIEEIADRLGLPRDALVIRRQGRIPRLYHRDGVEAARLSLSHHGRFVAYACALAPSGAVPTR